MDLDLELIESFCDESADLLLRWETVCLELSKSRDDDKLMQELFRLAHNLKGGSRAVGLGDYGNFIHKVEDGITVVRDRVVFLSDDVISLFLQAQKILLDWSLGVKSNIHFNPGDLSQFLNEYDNVLFNRQIEPVTGPKEPILEKSSNKSVKLSSGTGETIRVSAQKIDQLLQMIGELSIHQSIVWHSKSVSFQNSNRILTNSLQLSQKLTKELYDKALSLRMQPIASVFQRLERNIVELSKSLGKSVEVISNGGDVELDKTVIEKIIDPLTHIVRNAVDHGIEGMNDREKYRKNPTGKIWISAHQDTFGVLLTIKDDGKGLSVDRILAKAVEKNLVDESKSLSRDEILNLIFLPGFSTSDQITDVSGRGVGMNVVSTALEELQGHIRIESEETKGTSFVITLPTSVSIIEAMIIQINDQNYVAPVSAIDEVINLKDLGYRPGQMMFKLRDQVVPLIDLNQILNGKKVSSFKNENRSLMIIRQGSDRVGLIIDKVMGQQQIVIRPLNDIIDGAYGLMGGTILANGEPGLIVDIGLIAKDYIKKNKPKEVVA